MSQTVAVAVKGFAVTEAIDPKSKTEVPAKFKSTAVSALKSVQIDPPKGKTAGPYSADIVILIKKHPKGVRAEVKISFADQDPYSKRDRYLGLATGGATVPSANPDKEDTEAAVDAALDQALKTVISGIKDNAKKP